MAVIEPRAESSHDEKRYMFHHPIDVILINIIIAINQTQSKTCWNHKGMRDRLHLFVEGQVVRRHDEEESYCEVGFLELIPKQEANNCQSTSLQLACTRAVYRTGYARTSDDTSCAAGTNTLGGAGTARCVSQGTIIQIEAQSRTRA
ncbi:hypothetical protein EVAR_70124_1 [Eumeta japonica]|uniref:Uncharacterized protein n=1 Tax=Eumeta variegata TaxID=151549 RepID=A0A4C1Z2T8_EUMVA|nr:hypothetical protein EVAR_70124_1 [Eumeta japonica]